MERMASLQLLLILLAFSFFIVASHAIPSTRVERILQKNKGPLALADKAQIIREENIMEEAKFGRMELETNDYPGSGANDRHTPKPPDRS